MDFEVWITFVLASSALMLVPGPLMIFMIGVALNDGLPRAFTALFGLAIGIAVSISISLFGAGAILLASAQLFTALKVAGAAYLVYFGIRLWMSKPHYELEESTGIVDKASLFWPAFLVAVLNPKVLIFYIAFLPQFVNPVSAALPQFIVLGVTFIFVALGGAILCALLGSGLRRSAGRTKTLTIMSKCGAGAMIASGILTASSTHN